LLLGGRGPPGRKTFVYFTWSWKCLSDVSCVLGTSDPRVESLNLDRNKLKHIPGISKLGNLRKLILSKNEIADFPKEIQSLVHLEKLELNQNQIRVIPEGIFSCLPRLQHLRLNNNRLSALPKDLATCSSSLQYLNLSNNLFRAVPQAVLEPLKMFKAHGNPLQQPPNEVCAGGIQQILSYFSQLQNCQGEEDRRVKTMFLGASLAGKSTICKSLKQSPVCLNAGGDWGSRGSGHRGRCQRKWRPPNPSALDHCLGHLNGCTGPDPVYRKKGAI
uniref:Uncharacterized protein n=1 Tax=Chelonoidis abingdonii TaxID=106734 RepID=A0A8C0HCI0_CHEAB